MDETPEIFESFEQAQRAIISGDTRKIKDLMHTFMNLPEVEQEELRAFIEAYEDQAKHPTQNELISLQQVMDHYMGKKGVDQRTVLRQSLRPKVRPTSFPSNPEPSHENQQMSVNQIFEEFNKKPTSELISELNTKEKIEDKTPYISLLAKRFREDQYIISANNNNQFEIRNIQGNPVALEISQEDLAAIMILSGASSAEVVGDMLKQNIPNNVFDSVVQKFDHDINNNGQAWRIQDFLADDVRTEEEVQNNKDMFLGQVESKIATLKSILSQENTPEAKKQETIQWIQKLEITKAYIQNQSIFGENSLKMVGEISNTRRERARLFGNTAADQAKIDGDFEAGDYKRFLISQAPTLAVCGLFALLAKLLPTPFKEVVWGYIAAVGGLSVVEDLKKSGMLPEGFSMDLNGINKPKSSSSTVRELTDAVRNILTDAPTGLEQRHQTIYAKMVEENNKPENSYFSREQLDTMFVLSSQDYTFGNRDINSLENIGADEAFALLSENTQERLRAKGITPDNFLHFVKLLKHTSTDTQDTHIKDLFLMGQSEISENELTTTWVAGGDFEDQNKKINEGVSKLSGASYGVPEDIRGDSVRADTEEILAITQAGFLTWATASALDKADFSDWESTYPKVEDIEKVIEKLGDILTRTNISLDDKTVLEGIINEYKTIKISLEVNKEVNTFLDDARTIYTIPGRAERFLHDGLDWISAWGEPIVTTGSAALSGNNIDTLIEKGEAILSNGSIEEKKKEQVQIAIENLRLYQINRLDQISRDKDISDTERESARNQSNAILTSVILANEESKELYMNTLENLETEMAVLSLEYGNTNEYFRVLSEQKENIASLRRLAALNISEPDFPGFTTRVNSLYSSALTEGFIKNFSLHIANLNSKIEDINTSPSTATKLDESEESLDSVANEIFIGRGEGLIIDTILPVLNYFGVVKESAQSVYNNTEYYDTSKVMALTLQRLDSDITPISFDTSKLDTTRMALDNARVEIIGNIDSIPLVNTEKWENTIDISTTEGINAAILAVQTQARQIAKVEGATRKKLDKQIAAVINRFTEKIKALNIDDSTNEKLDKIVTLYEKFTTANGVKDASGEDFDTSVDEYKQAKKRIQTDISKLKYENKLSSTTLMELDEGQRAHINNFIKSFKEVTTLKPQLASRLNGLKRDSTELRIIIEILSAISDKNFMGQDVTGLQDNEIGSYGNLPTQTIRDNATNALRNFQLSISDNEIFSQIFTKYGNVLSLKDYFGI